MPKSKKKPLFDPTGDQIRVKKSTKNLTTEDITALGWYYRIELKLSCFTRGFKKHSVARSNFLHKET